MRLSMMLVQTSERRSSLGRPRRTTDERAAAGPCPRRAALSRGALAGQDSCRRSGAAPRGGSNRTAPLPWRRPVAYSVR
jgi:hypothetical protein